MTSSTVAVRQPAQVAPFCHSRYFSRDRARNSLTSSSLGSCPSSLAMSSGRRRAKDRTHLRHLLIGQLRPLDEVAEFVVVLVEEDEHGDGLELAVLQVRLNQVFVLVALKDADLDAHRLSDLRCHRHAAIDIGAPVFADDGQRGRALRSAGDRLELCGLGFCRLGAVVIAVEEVAVADAALEVFLVRLAGLVTLRGDGRFGYLCQKYLLEARVCSQA